jgi:hypothetical protein
MVRGGGGEEEESRVWVLLTYSIGIHIHTHILTYNTSLYIRERRRRIQGARQDPHTDYVIFSLSRREESCKDKLFACLLVCPYFTDWSKRKVKTNATILHKTWPKVIGGQELKSEVSFLQFFWGSIFYTKDHFFLKKIIFYKVWPQVIGGGNSESAVSLINYELVINCSLSRREESSKHKLSAWLLACVSALHWLVRE